MDLGTRRAHPARRSARSPRASTRTNSCEKSQTDKHTAIITNHAPLSRLSSRQAASHANPNQTTLTLPGMGDRVRAMRVLDDRTEADAGSANIRFWGERPETDQQRRHAIVAREGPDPTRLRRTASSRQHTARFAATRPASFTPRPTRHRKRASGTGHSNQSGAGGSQQSQIGGAEPCPVPVVTDPGAKTPQGAGCRRLPLGRQFRVPNRSRCRKLPSGRRRRTKSRCGLLSSPGAGLGSTRTVGSIGSRVDKLSGALRDRGLRCLSLPESQEPLAARSSSALRCPVVGCPVLPAGLVPPTT